MVYRARTMRQIALTAAGVAALVPSAVAQQPNSAQANAIRQACRADYQAHCANVPTGGSAALSCLQQNSASLSQSCQAALGAMSGGGMTQGNAAPPPAMPSPPMTPRQEMAMLRYSCGRDYRAFCSDIRPGGGRAIACLEGHAPSLSRQCRSALLAARERR